MGNCLVNVRRVSSTPVHVLAVSDGLTGPFGKSVHHNESRQEEIRKRESLRVINPRLGFKSEVSFIYYFSRRKARQCFCPRKIGRERAGIINLRPAPLFSLPLTLRGKILPNSKLQSRTLKRPVAGSLLVVDTRVAHRSDVGV